MKQLNKVILSIDTSHSDSVFVELEDRNGKKEVKSFARMASSQTLLPLIDELLRKSNHKVRDITAIRVHLGPGSYTGLRVGVAVANSLGKLLGIPVNGVKDSCIEPMYSF